MASRLELFSIIKQKAHQYVLSILNDDAIMTKLLMCANELHAAHIDADSFFSIYRTHRSKDLDIGPALCEILHIIKTEHAQYAITPCKSIAIELAWQVRRFCLSIVFVNSISKKKVKATVATLHNIVRFITENNILALVGS
jgi:hypothetical protein